jgi:flavodoxin
MCYNAALFHQCCILLSFCSIANLRHMENRWLCCTAQLFSCVCGSWGEIMATTRILIVYYSRSGNTERVAKDIAVRLGADVEQVTDKKNRAGFLGYFASGKDAVKENLTEIGLVKKNPAEYDIVIFGTPMWAGNITPALRTYIMQKKTMLKKVAWFITAGGSSDMRVVAHMEKATGIVALAHAGFNGYDLRNEKAYNEKLSTFVEHIRTATEQKIPAGVH